MVVKELFAEALELVTVFLLNLFRLFISYHYVKEDLFILSLIFSLAWVEFPKFQRK